MEPKLLEGEEEGAGTDTATETKTKPVTWEKLLEAEQPDVEKEDADEDEEDDEDEEEDVSEDTVDDIIARLEGEGHTADMSDFDPKPSHSPCGCWG